MLRVGLGTNRLADDDRSRGILQHALERTRALGGGRLLVDTAELYGNGVSERVVGSVLRDSDDVLIATKGGYHDGSPQEIAAAIDASRDRLGRDVIDLYYLHRPHPDVAVEHSVDPVISAIQDGRVRRLGLSNVTLDQVDRVHQIHPVAAVQNAFSPAETDQQDVIDYCERNGIMFVAHSPLRDTRKAKRLAKRLGVERVPMVLAALLARSPAVAPIPGTLRPEHFDANLSALSLPVAPEDVRALGLAR